MISEVFAQHPWLWTLAWQSTACLAAGMAGSILLRRRPVRAHQLLLLSLVAAMLIPALSHAVKQNQWGLFVAERTVSIREAPPFIVQTDPVTTAPASVSDAAAAQVGATVTPPKTAAPSRPRFQWQTALPLLWLGATSALLLRLVVRLLLGWGLIRRSAPAQSRPIAQALDGAKAKLGIEGDVIVRASHYARSPVIWCWSRRPVLLVPSDFCGNAHLDWSSILCHELAHWRRRDHVSSLLAELMICLLPWQPLSWLVRWRLADLSEEACDDWVIASGQVGTRYARTLLSLTALGQAALIPAVGTTRTGLAGRIRRIVRDECSNPCSGLRWTSAAVTLTTCIAITLAFAQTRLVEQMTLGTIVLGHGAVIEQPIRAETVRGVVLDSSGKPTNASIISLPATTDGLTTPEDGQFELPWSPDWSDEGGTLYLVAKGGTNEAAFIEVSDPTLPVIVHLAPALALEARVVDANGSRIERYDATLSPSTGLKYEAPIFETGVGVPRVEIFSQVPRGAKYDLTIHADGYATKHVIVDTSATGTPVIDLGEIVLESQGVAEEDMPRPGWEDAFNRVYRLRGGETLKLIKAPFMIERHQALLTKWQRHTPLLLQTYGRFKGGFRWGDQLSLRSGLSGGPLRLRTMLYLMVGIPKYDFEIPRGLNVALPDGDWIIREGSTVAEQLKALEEIIDAELQQPIRFEKRTIERKTVVVTGAFSFTPVIAERADRICIFVDPNEQIAYRQGETDSLIELFRDIGNELDVAFEVRTEQTQITKTRYHYSSSLNVNGARDANLPILLDNLARQTGLRFTMESLPAEVWFVTERQVAKNN